jgi:hypothetical protein
VTEREVVLKQNQAYSPEFRAEAAKLVLEQGLSQEAAAKRLAIPMRARMTQELTARALFRAVQQKRPPPALQHKRGGQSLNPRVQRDLLQPPTAPFAPRLFGTGRVRTKRPPTRQRRLRQKCPLLPGHLKTDGRMDRCRPKGALGDALNAVLVAAGHNIRLLLRAMADLLRRLLGRLSVALSAVLPQHRAETRPEGRPPRSGLFRTD